MKKNLAAAVALLSMTQVFGQGHPCKDDLDKSARTASCPVAAEAPLPAQPTPIMKEAKTTKAAISRKVAEIDGHIARHEQAKASGAWKELNALRTHLSELEVRMKAVEGDVRYLKSNPLGGTAQSQARAFAAIGDAGFVTKSWVEERKYATQEQLAAAVKAAVTLTSPAGAATMSGTPATAGTTTSTNGNNVTVNVTPGGPNAATPGTLTAPASAVSPTAPATPAAEAPAAATAPVINNDQTVNIPSVLRHWLQVQDNTWYAFFGGLAVLIFLIGLVAIVVKKV